MVGLPSTVEQQSISAMTLEREQQQQHLFHRIGAVGHASSSDRYEQAGEYNCSG